MKTLIVVALTFGVAACGDSGGGDDGESTALPKNLFSKWENVDTGDPLDLIGGKFDTRLGAWLYFPDGSKCECEFLFSGDQSSGAYGIFSSWYVPSTGSGTDPGCNSLVGTGSYTNADNTLTMTPSSGSPSVYR